MAEMWNTFIHVDAASQKKEVPSRVVGPDIWRVSRHVNTPRATDIIAPLLSGAVLIHVS